ncbi:hypothetical protein B1B04_08965 [Lysinibacillus sp. KCTC 33748]|uniref:hypothetical protein n=1 Tax=unclassified Lysinibacillus TaxID=2636778 RepID=UPI0009A8E09D|nr:MULTISPECIES: hypothetical protein [unclassified Lysinibacillus]OXS75002.1 hypothetical protein B1B04_08965 [Lysinibacillus sp. KCTC 33748]SKB61692.1 BclB C-terminal domain-containing protein [Lysinibacillus sp. AC-3]
MNNCGCNNESPTSRTCDKFGTFTANDVNCINTFQVDNGSIIPFSSGRNVVVANFFGGDRISGQVGFGTARNGSLIIDNTIDLAGNLSEAFTVPRKGNIIAISATYILFLTSPPFQFSLSTIRAQIFHAPQESNIFTGTTASVDLTPPPVGGRIAFASANTQPVPLSAGDRLVMVFYVSSPSTDPLIINGRASAGINIV